jgi:hypothetical protein
MSQIHVVADGHIRPWPARWTAADLACADRGDHLAPLDVLLPGALLVRVLHPFVATDSAGAFGLLRFTSVHVAETGVGRGLAPFATLDDPAPSRPSSRQDVLEGLARALDAAIGAEARRTRLLLQAFLQTRVGRRLPDASFLSLRLPPHGRGMLRLRHGPPHVRDVLAKRLPPPLLARAARLRVPDGRGGLAPPETLPWLPTGSAHATLAAQDDLERLLLGEAA